MREPHHVAKALRESAGLLGHVGRELEISLAQHDHAEIRERIEPQSRLVRTRGRERPRWPGRAPRRTGRGRTEPWPAASRGGAEVPAASAGCEMLDRLRRPPGLERDPAPQTG